MSEIQSLCLSLESMDPQTSATLVGWVNRCDTCPDRDTCSDRDTCPGVSSALESACPVSPSAVDRQALADLRQLAQLHEERQASLRARATPPPIQ